MSDWTSKIPKTPEAPQEEKAPKILKVATPEFRAKMVEFRTLKKYTRADLAKAINVQSTVIRDIENGKNVPDIVNVLQKIRGLYRINV